MAGATTIISASSVGVQLTFLLNKFGLQCLWILREQL